MTKLVNSADRVPLRGPGGGIPGSKPTRKTPRRTQGLELAPETNSPSVTSGYGSGNKSTTGKLRRRRRSLKNQGLTSPSRKKGKRSPGAPYALPKGTSSQPRPPRNSAKNKQRYYSAGTVRLLRASNGRPYRHKLCVIASFTFKKVGKNNDWICTHVNDNLLSFWLDWPLLKVQRWLRLARETGWRYQEITDAVRENGLDTRESRGRKAGNVP